MSPARAPTPSSTPSCVCYQNKSAIPLPVLPWPLPALLTWGAAWWLYQAALGWWGSPLLALLLASGLGWVASGLVAGWWRRWLLALGFPLALVLTGTVAVPAWVWLLPLGLLLALYPLQAWRDAPLFPTPAGALDALAQHAPLPAGAWVLDAGCGLGHGLLALRAAYPQAQLWGVERSRPLALLCRLRCRFARVDRGDIWRLDWGGCQLVYLFQRPESMARAAAKAQREMAPGTWLVSLAFEVPGLSPSACLPAPAPQGALWLYRIGPAGGQVKA